MFEKSKDVLTQTIRQATTFSFGKRPVFTNYLIVGDGKLVFWCQMRLLDAQYIS